MPDARPQTDRDTWVRAATQTLADSGVDGVRVETLARGLGLTKGSFYWHFKDRRALLDAVLEHWRDGRIDDIRNRTQSAPGDEIAQLQHVIDTYSLARNRRGMQVELALRDWARHDEAARAAVDEVGQRAAGMRCRAVPRCRLRRRRSDQSQSAAVCLCVRSGHDGCAA
ncbi:MAG: TetR/AcrR family transcriptional regulator [Methyloversatilis sp.]|uniref:TetR/AcrR family transcriptional regulator n=1 Tax=Methyloversatilis sp. TaxID=2569862 RepID=UPI0025E1AF75|nr:TetR/AcrR family transcriptional regulator [Methyloversatilis sp.]MCR6666156.1 TetR/AcrR family transcriptional regulator [Methyloversatilis sp.]